MKQKESQVTIVLPTRNRMFSLNRLLYSISKQTYLPKEIIIVDSSDEKLTTSQLILPIQLEIKIIHSTPSVCLQRNIGIEECNTEFIFLCDDDIEISKNYIEESVHFLERNPSENIVSGLIFEKRKGHWTYCNKAISTKGLIMAYLFGTSLTIDINKAVIPKCFIFKKITDFYHKKDNHISKAGWPIITNFKNNVIKTPIYGLGASIIRAQELKNKLFDTAFYTHGVGDNYDLAINLNCNINVIKKAEAFHHKESINRINSNKAYYYRVSALHYIMKKHKLFNNLRLAYLIWSLIGNSILFLFKGKLKLLFYNFELIGRIIFNTPLYKSKH